ncbi:YbaL family putative K(+) efflux transporter [Arboricoccus pini]|nr:YbaL family putative K(+) efflux transporter [Arboricoccus pini]
MPHYSPLIATIVAALVLAFILGTIVQRLKASPLVGYLLAGILIGPFTPGFVADQNLANELAEIGVILLMFGVGLHFSLKDLLSVKGIAVPGAVAQIAVATLMGMGLAWAMGWPTGNGLVFGLALSVASTVVLLRALQERRLVETEQGRIAVGWLIVEDMAMVLTLVLLPVAADLLADNSQALDSSAILMTIFLTIGKVAAFIAVMLIVGRRVIPWLLHYVAHTGSRELFRLAVLAIALGVAYGAALLFDVSFALGAFFAGMVLSESELSQRAAEETLPLRDAFAVLFFVSVGMLFDPKIIIEEPLHLLATLGIIIIGKSVAAYLIVRAFGHASRTALTISASLAQIGEFSFILMALGGELGLVTQEANDLVLAGAIISIILNPLLFTLIARFGRTTEKRADEAAPERCESAPVEKPSVSSLKDHAVLVGFGRVGALVGAGLAEAGKAFLVIEERQGAVDAARQAGGEAILGNAADPLILAASNVAQARLLFIAIPQSFEAGQVAAQARKLNPGLEIVARAHSDAEVEHLLANGATLAIMGEREIARGMLNHIARPVAGAEIAQTLSRA